MRMLEDFNEYYSGPIKSAEKLESVLKELNVYQSCEEVVSQVKHDLCRYAHSILERRLISRHPMLFRTTLLGHIGKHKNYQRLRGLGIEAPIGWYDLIDDMCTAIEEVVKGTDVEPVFICIKEKFGTMRPWLELYSELPLDKRKLINDILDKAEAESAKTCQDCGKPGKRRSGNWVATLCDEHAKEDNDQDQR